MGHCRGCDQSCERRYPGVVSDAVNGRTGIHLPSFEQRKVVMANYFYCPVIVGKPFEHRDLMTGWWAASWRLQSQ